MTLGGEEDSESGSEDEDSEDSEDSDYASYKVATKDDYVPVEIKSKKKTKGGKLGEIVETEQAAGQLPQLVEGQDGWNQPQQKALEAALQQFPKGTLERWDRIASKVSGKSKEECMLRVRYLAEVVKKKKEADCLAASAAPVPAAS